MGSTDGDPPETKKDDALSGPKKVEDEKPKDDGLSGPKKAQDEKQDEEPKDDNLAGPKKAEDEKPKDDDTKDKPPSVITVPEDKNCSILKESDVWDVESVKGNIAKKAAMSFVPGSLGKKKRRISIEVHSILPPFYEEEEGEEVKKSVVTKVKEKVMEKIKGKKEPEKPPEVPRIDQAYIRVMKPRPLNKEKAINAVKQVGEGAGSAVKVARSVNVTKHIPVKKDTPKEEEAKDDDDDEKSDSGSESDDSSAGSNDDDFDFDDSVVSPEWKTKSTLRLSDVTLKKRDKDTCTLIVRDRNNKEKTKEFAFEDEKAAIDFESKINKQVSLGPERDEDRFKAVLGSTEMKDEKEPLGLLVEIIGGVDLPILDMTSSDPYVVAKFDREVIHKTVHLPKSLNPIWTIKTGSMFVFDVRAKELFQNYEGLCLEVLDYDAYGGHDVMGIVKIPPKFLYSASEEREEFPLRPLKAKGANSNVSGKLAIRCRKATNYDKEFLEEYNEYQKQKKKKDPVKLKAGFKVLKQAGKGGTDIVKNTVAVQVKKKEKVDGNTVVKYKVRPEPDPERVSTTTWMTKEDVLLESMKESRVWADAGSGTLAKVYVEVLSCTGLPNMDMGVNLNNKTDSFCKIVYEDCMCETDVIDDCLSPCWMPWSNRAFILHTQHTSSPLFIGVFDYDSGLNDRLDGHDPIGRVSVDMSNLRADTVYVLHYQLWTEEKIIADRKPNGTLKIRLRLEVPDKRELVFSSLQPYHNVYVNTKQNKEYKCAKYVAKGPDEEKFSTDTLKAYQAELMAYLDLIVYIKDALINLFLWRGTFKVSLTKSKSVMLPLHSLTLFIAGVTLVENPYLLPSYSCGSIAWLLLAVMDFRLSNPDPWDRCKSFREMVEIIIAGQPLGTTTIAENENSEEAAAFRKKWEDKIEEMQRKAIEAKEKKAKEAAEEEEITGEEEEELETKDSSISINPLKPILYPLQKILCVVLEYVRFIKNIIFWEECYYAFWTTSASIIFAVFFLFIPWKFIMVWSARIVVWAVLGPWMKLVDIFFYRKIESMTKEEAKKREKAMKEAREVYLEKLRRDKRIKQEETTKMKEIKKYMFGKYSTNVPVLKTDRFRDVPLPASTASPYTPEEYSTAQLAMEEAGSNLKRLEGQNVQGVMIPRQVDGVEKVTKGQKVSSTRKLKKGSLAAKVLGAEAEKSAIPKIGKVMLVATVAAWAGFPVIKSVAQSTATQVMSFF